LAAIRLVNLERECELFVIVQFYFNFNFNFILTFLTSFFSHPTQNEHLKNCYQSVVTSAIPSLIQQMQTPDNHAPPLKSHRDYDEDSGDEEDNPGDTFDPRASSRGTVRREKSQREMVRQKSQRSLELSQV
jgi:hypothetical protein